MARAVGMNHIAIEVGSLDEALAAAREAGTKAPEILRGMGLELEKSESALRELRDKGLA